GGAGGAEAETRLVRTRDEAYGDACLPPQQPDEGGAVPRFAHRARRHRAHALDVPRAGQTPERLERAKGQLRGLAIELAARECAVAEAHHLLEAIDHLDPPLRTNVGHQHVQRIGADVDRGQPHRGYDTCPHARSHVKAVGHATRSCFDLLDTVTRASQFPRPSMSTLPVTETLGSWGQEMEVAGMGN